MEPTDSRMQRIVLPPNECPARPSDRPMHSSPRAILLFSLEPWGDMWYSKHHYAAFLAKRYPVYFISLPDRWRWTDLFSMNAKVRTVKEGVHVVEYRNNLPLRLLPQVIERAVNRLNAWKLRRLVPSTDLLLWCFHPAAVAESKTLRRGGTKVVYHVVDPYQSLANDTSFAKGSDLIAAINPWYVDYYGRFNDHCILTPHGVRAEDRTPRPAQVSHYQRLWGRYAIMAAGLNHRTNYALLIEVARKRPDLRLVIAGQLFELPPDQLERRDALFAMPNVTYVGVKHPDVLRDIIRGAVMGLVTYDFEPTRSLPVTGDGTPLKVITYLAQGCPAISTINSYVPTLDGHGAYKAEDPVHFVKLVEDVLEGRLATDVEHVEAYLDSVDYDRLTGAILDRLYPATTEEVRAHEVVQQPGPEERPIVPADSVILIISNEEWDGPRYSKHRFAVALKRYRKVIFIDPVTPWRPAHLLQWKIRTRPTPEGITVLTYQNPIPLMGGALGSFNDRLVSYRIRRYLRREGIPWPLFWSFDPSRLLTPKQLRAVRAVYHCADDHTFRWKGEKTLARNCDHIFCIARDLMPRFRPLNDSVHHVPHGIAVNDLVVAPHDTPELPVRPGYGLYIGNINDRHDFVIWERLFKEHPEVNFLIIGPERVTDPVGRRLIDERPYPNVLFLPPVPYEQLASIIGASGFGFLFLKPDHPANRISSQKVIQFLAQGKPFFCSWLSEYSEVPGPTIHVASDVDEALALFREFQQHGDPPEAAAARLRLAREQLYPNLIRGLPFRL